MCTRLTVYTTGICEIAGDKPSSCSICDCGGLSESSAFGPRTLTVSMPKSVSSMHFLKGLADCRFGPQHADPAVGDFCYILRKSTKSTSNSAVRMY